ncbi:TPA: helix-turn-helix domain-containing protein [Elizabethkingia anophelis]|nr:hypothetical protein [Elizabethkingia anophelis]
MNKIFDTLKQNIFEELVGNIQQVVREELKNAQSSFIPSKEDETFYSLEQVAEMLGISPKTMYSLNNRKEIGYSKLAGKCYYHKKDIIEAINKGRVKTRYEIELEAINSVTSLRRNTN